MSEINNNNEYIPRAERRNKDGLTEKEFLEQYNPGHYERPSVTVDMLLFGMSRDLKCLKVLLIKRNNHPYIDCYALPGGFVNITESAYTAACRELEEETGYLPEDYNILYTPKYPFTVSPGYTQEKLYLYVVQLKNDSILPQNLKLDEGEDLSGTWFNLEEVENISQDMKTILALHLFKSL